ncbi:hypothetical protein G6F64_009792 [Rhizopus arrhizus]|uniref:Zn(2)-C6 fungal-type domain-containing protein n=1 Tax=Rhizopus oryzae TaxID=64495 RepID=A0A9P6X2M2_RHIOR|nr:hypothetical protein G6F64_009792 [Rhizopus arrhizus]
MQNIQNSSTTPLYWGAEEGLSPTYSSPTPSPSHSNIKTLETKRSRVSRACDICRRKKTKCDADDTKQCKTCLQYGWECTFNDTTKKRGPPKGYIESLENRLKRMESLLEQIQPKDHHSESAVDEVEQPPQKKRIVTPMQMPTSIEHTKATRYLGSSSGYYLVRDILSTDKEVVERIEHYPRISDAMGTENKGPMAIRKINTNDDDVMMVYDRSLAEHVNRLKMDKSYFKDDIAPKELLNELLLRFFEMDHDTLPVVDREPFMDAYQGRIQPPPATVLVYAIWTYTFSILPPGDPLLKKYNIEDSEHLFEVFWEHTSSIMRSEYLTPRYATIQALVLLCMIPNTHNVFHKNWVRAGMAVRMAQELGLHRTIEKLPVTKDTVEARKRLWYCVYVTDRWICAVMGRPLAIADADCDVDLPEIQQGGKDYSLFVNFIKLSGILGEVLSRIYSPKAKARGYKNTLIYHTVLSIHTMLDDWLSQLPNHLRINLEANSTNLSEAGPLIICYHVIIILLYRTFLVSSRHEVLPELFDMANERCTTSAKSIVDIARILVPSIVTSFGWNFAGFAVFQASLIHIYNSTSSNPELASSSRAYAQIAMEECIKTLGKTVKSFQKNVLSVLQHMMDITGVSKEGSRPTNATAASSANLDHHTNIGDYTHRPCSTKPSQPSAMSMHTIVSNWESNMSPSNASSSNDHLPMSQEFVTNNAAWQSLFASAAAPFIGDEGDWQAMLSSLFDESQMKPEDNYIS